MWGDFDQKTPGIWGDFDARLQSKVAGGSSGGESGGGASGGTKFETFEIAFTTDGENYLLLCPIADENGNIVSIREIVEVGKTYYFPKSSSSGEAVITVLTLGVGSDLESLMVSTNSTTDSIGEKYVDCMGMGAIVSVKKSGKIYFLYEEWQ